MDATIVVPTYNRCPALLETLEALARVDHPHDRWEIVVVDDGSTDDTADAVAERATTLPVACRYLRQANTGPAAARNRGAAAARGRILIFIDNDIIVPPDFVRRHLNAHAASPGAWIVGEIVNPVDRSTPFGRYLARSRPSVRVGRDAVETQTFTAANLSMPADDFHRVGGFDPGFTIASCEDWELAMRARHAGVRILFTPGLAAEHRDWAVTLDRFCERQRLYSVSDCLLLRKHGTTSPRARLVGENAPIDLRADGPRLAAKKAMKWTFATRAGRAGIRAACRIAERLAPDSRWADRLYQTAVALAIFRGVREGLRRYGAA